MAAIREILAAENQAAKFFKESTYENRGPVLSLKFELKSVPYRSMLGACAFQFQPGAFHVHQFAQGVADVKQG